MNGYSCSRYFERLDIAVLCHIKHNILYYFWIVCPKVTAFLFFEMTRRFIARNCIYFIKWRRATNSQDYTYTKKESLWIKKKSESEDICHYFLVGKKVHMEVKMDNKTRLNRLTKSRLKTITEKKCQVPIITGHSN